MEFVMTHPYRKAMSYLALAKESRAHLLSYKDLHKDQEVYIFGTGPSIKKFNFPKAKGKTAIYLNNAVGLRERIESNVEYAVITDFIRARELRDQLTSKKITTFCSTDKIFNPVISEIFFQPPFVFIMPKLTYEFKERSVACTPSDAFMIAHDLSQGIYLGKSVVFAAIQLAWFMGHKKIHLVGVDMTSNKGEYYDPQIKGHWAGFSYEKDGREHFREIARRFSAEGIEIFDHSETGLNDQVLKFKYLEGSK
jgi:hypothetical protein